MQTDSYADSLEREYRIIVPVADLATATDLLNIAEAMIHGHNGRIILLAIVEVPEERSLSEGAGKAQYLRLKIGEIPSLRQAENVEIQSIVRVSHQIWQGIMQAVHEEQGDLLILGWKGFTTTPQKVYGTTIDEIMKSPPCDVVIAKTCTLNRCRRVLLPVRGGPYAEFALKVATRLSEGLGAEITVMHSVQGEDSSDLGDEPYQAFQHLLEATRQVTRVVTVQASAGAAIVEEAENHDLIIMGTAAQLGEYPSALGPITEAVARRVDKTLLIVKTREPADFAHYLQSSGIAVSQDIPVQNLSQMVDKWFAENTFHSREFADIGKLVEMKRKQGTTISVGLPALNEEKTIGKIIETIKGSLVDQHPLLDELVVIDSGSTDATVEIARGLGVPVYQHSEILPGCGSYRGKGEALWKSLHVLKGDIVAWIDTDIRNIHPGFVYGIVGPLLREPQIKYVKGFYRRPLQMGEKLTATGGGRVTELTARPLFNLFFPELSGLIQPLSGEYAGRREVLERVPFFTGYGVETGLLIDIYERFGLRAIAQADLEERIHRNQTLMALSQMAFAIIQVFIHRLEDRHRLHLVEEVNRSLKLIVDSQEGYSLDLKEIRDYERPPIVSIPEYRQWRKEKNG